MYFVHCFLLCIETKERGIASYGTYAREGVLLVMTGRFVAHDFIIVISSLVFN